MRTRLCITLCAALLYVFWILQVQPFPEADPEWIFLRPNQLSAWILSSVDWTVDDLLLVTNREYPWGLLWPSFLFHGLGCSESLIQSPYLVSLLALALLVTIPTLSGRDEVERLLFSLFLFTSPLTFLILTDVHPHSFCALLFVIAWLLWSKGYKLFACSIFILAAATKQLGMIFLIGMLLSCLWKLNFSKQKGELGMHWILASIFIAMQFYHPQESGYIWDTFRRYSDVSQMGFFNLILYLSLAWLGFSIVVSSQGKNEFWQSIAVIVLIPLSISALILTSYIAPGEKPIGVILIGWAIFSCGFSFLVNGYRDFCGIELWIFASLSLVLYLWMASINHNPYVLIWLLLFYIAKLAMNSQGARGFILLISLIQMLFLVLVFARVLPVNQMLTLHSAMRQGPYHLLGSLEMDQRWGMRAQIYESLAKLKLEGEQYYYFLSVPETDFLRYSFRPPNLQMGQINLVPWQRDMDLWAQSEFAYDLDSMGFENFYHKYLHKIAAILTHCSLDEKRQGFAWFDSSAYFEEDLRNEFKGIFLFRMNEDLETEPVDFQIVSNLNQNYCLYLNPRLRKDNAKDANRIWKRWKNLTMHRLRMDKPLDSQESIKAAFAFDRDMKEWRTKFLRNLAIQEEVYKDLEETDFSEINEMDCKRFQTAWRNYPYHEPFRKYLNSKCKRKLHFGQDFVRE